MTENPDTCHGGIATVRSDLNRRLAKLMRAVVRSYDLFSTGEVPLDAKGFTAHHVAAKAALAHLDVLAKLSKWAAPPTDENDAGNHDAVARLMVDARAAIDSFPEDET